MATATSRKARSTKAEATYEKEQPVVDPHAELFNKVLDNTKPSQPKQIEIPNGFKLLPAAERSIRVNRKFIEDGPGRYDSNKPFILVEGNKETQYW